jgi:predicted PurR-regulated permease PerM
MPTPRSDTQATTGWLRDEATIAARLMVLTVSALFAIWLARQISIITVAVFLAFAQAALLWPLARWLSRAIPKGVAALLVVACYVAAIVRLVWFVVIELVNAWPVLVAAVSGSIDEANSWFLRRGWSIPPSVIDHLQGQLETRAASLFSGIGTVAITGLGLVGQFTTIMVVATFATLFALAGGTSLAEATVALAPGHRRGSMRSALRAAVTTARWWMLASTLTGVVDGLLIGVGLHLLGVIPMVGATLAGAIAVAVGLFFGGINTAVAVLVLVLAVQQIEGNVLSPLLMSRAMQFPPLVTLIVATAGGAAFGLLGLFLAVPVAGIITAAVKGWRHPDGGSGDLGGDTGDLGDTGADRKAPRSLEVASGAAGHLRPDRQRHDDEQPEVEHDGDRPTD